MSSSAESQENDLPATQERQKGRTSWEIEELASVGILSALSLVAIFYFASGWAISDEGVGVPPSQRLHVFLIYTSEWAGIFGGFLVLVALGLVWWQVDGWTERLADLDTAEESDSTIGDSNEAITHLLRNRSLSTACGVLCVAGLLASVGGVVGYAIGAGGDLGVPWGSVLGPIGQLLGFLVLAAVGVVAIVRLRATCTDALDIDDPPTSAP